MTLDPQSLKELTWWRNNLALNKSKPIKIQNLDKIIESNTLKMREWGAHFHVRKQNAIKIERK